MTGAPDRKPSDLPKRTIVALLLAAVAIGCLYAGGILWWILASLLAMLMLVEWCDLAKVPEREKRLTLFTACVPLAIMSPLAAGPYAFAFGLTIGAGFFATIVTRNPRLGFGIAYVGLPALALLYLRGLPQGLLIAFWVLASVWATDIGAYFAGRTFGGPKLAPTISPNKTWSGLVGGIVAALIVGLLLSRFAGLPLQLAIASPILAVIAQIGDLYESGLKRQAGVKDSGTILPGHGGVLDRLDGLVPAAPAAAMLILVNHFMAGQFS